MNNEWRTEDSTREYTSTPEPHFNESYDTNPCNFGYIPTVKEYDEALGRYHTALLVVGGIVTAVLYVLFLEQVVFICRNANKVFRRHIIWISSVYPFMTLMSLMSVVVPRADQICTAIKVTYMSIGLSHFTDLTTLMFGSEKVMLATLTDSKFNLKVGPACWCCLCFPSPVVSKRGLRVVRWLLWQMPYTQAIYFIIRILLITAETDPSGKVDPNSSYLWLNILNFFSFLSGIYALQIFAFVSKGFLDHYNYDVYKLTVENAIYLLEMTILGPYAYWQYRDYEFLTRNPTDVADLTYPSKERSVSTVSKVSEAAAYGVITFQQPEAPDGYVAPPPPYSTTPKTTKQDRGQSVYLDLSASVLQQRDAPEKPRTTEDKRR